jgi:hypothetical protein
MANPHALALRAEGKTGPYPIALPALPAEKTGHLTWIADRHRFLGITLDPRMPMTSPSTSLMVRLDRELPGHRQSIHRSRKRLAAMMHDH